MASAENDTAQFFTAVIGGRVICVLFHERIGL